MGLIEALKVALDSLRANKLRSFLTLLGVMIGVASVIMVITLVDGANRFVATKVYSFGADVLTAAKQPMVVLSDSDYIEYDKRKNLTLDDYKAVTALCRDCAATGAMANVTGRVVYGNHSSTDTDIRGWTAGMASMYNESLDRGRAFAPVDGERRRHVAIAGYDIAHNQMGGEDPIGKEIRVDGQRYTVIGVGEKKGKTLGQSQDNWVAIPLSTFLSVYGADRSITIYARAKGVGDPLELAAGEVRNILRSRRRDAPGAKDSFSLETNTTFLGIWQSISSSFAVVVVSLAAISLVVGGIVIMNIMLVSVTERTREIGVRKALGARQSDVLTQFLIEAAALSLAGGVLGVLGGVAVAKAITLAVGFPSRIQLWPIVLGLLTSTGVGLFFGIYPARKAARLDPIAALRSEL